MVWVCALFQVSSREEGCPEVGWGGGRGQGLGLPGTSRGREQSGRVLELLLRRDQQGLVAAWEQRVKLEKCDRGSSERLDAILRGTE